MSSLVIWFTAMIATIVPLNKAVDSAPYSAVDINKLLELVQQQQENKGISKQRRLQLSEDSSESDSVWDDSSSESDTSSDSNDNRYARLRKERIIELIEKVANEKTNRAQTGNDEVMTAYIKGKSDGQKHFRSRGEKIDNSQGNTETQILKQLLSNGINDKERKTKPKKRLVPNRLLGDGPNNEITDYNKHEDVPGLNEYSKIYIVLNPQAVLKSRHKNSLNELVSKVLALSSPKSEKDRQGKTKKRHYKGFVINEDQLSKQSRREPRELSAPRYSRGDDYNSQKRSRYGGIVAGRRIAVPT